MTKLITLKPKSGLITELQSDTIYGHFCWRLIEKSGTNKLTDFINHYRNGNPIFLLSDGLLISEDEIFFPAPYLFKKPITKGRQEDKILEFVKRKYKKESVFLTLSQLNEFIYSSEIQVEASSGNNSGSVNKIYTPKIEEQLRVSVRIDRQSFAAEEHMLFSYNPKFVPKNFSYAILSKVLNENLFDEFRCSEILRDVFTLGFGKKKSSGYGQFAEEIKIDPFDKIQEPNESNAFLILGNYLPAVEDGITPIGFDTNTKYGKFGEELAQSHKPFKNPIIFLTAGSCFKTSNAKKTYYGRVTNEKEISEYHKDTVQFGCPFFLRIKTQ